MISSDAIRGGTQVRTVITIGRMARVHVKYKGFHSETLAPLKYDHTVEGVYTSSFRRTYGNIHLVSSRLATSQT